MSDYSSIEMDSIDVDASDARDGQAEQRLASLLSVGTSVPAHWLSQDEISQWMAGAFSERPAVARAVRSLHTHSGIDRRYSCCPEYLRPVEDSRFTPGEGGAAPTTADRMAIYAREAPALGVDAARQALERYAAGSSATVQDVADSITHLVVVSCTGFFAPGLDFVIAQQLGLSSTISRTLIGFMGCSAAFNGLRTAQQIVRSEPDARVLVVCVELCSLHIQQDTSPAHLIAMSLFADGAAACLVGKAAPGDRDVFHLEAFHSEIQPDTESEMVWEIGDRGFILHLSPQIPEHVALAAPATLAHLFPGQTPSFWAIHPGGRAIVDRLQKVFGLAPEQVAASREVLRRYGNLSSATILFVLDELRERMDKEATEVLSPAVTPLPPPAASAGIGANGASLTVPSGNGAVSGVAMAFGPGLVIEMARLAYVPVVGGSHKT